MQKYQYRVKPGFRHGAFGQYGPGDTVELTEQEAKGFLDKLQLIGESLPANITASSPSVTAGGLLVTPAELQKAKDAAMGGQSSDTPPTPTGNEQGNQQPPANSQQPFDVVAANMDEVLAAVKEGKISAGAALIAEQQGNKKRTTLIAELTKLVEAENTPPQG